jgi:hypothetical protein
VELLLLLLAIAGMWLLFRGFRREKSSERPAPRLSQQEPVMPAQNLGRLIRLSSDGRVGVVGESHYQPALRATANGRVSGEGLDGNIPASATLVPDPGNRYDSNAVRVDIDSRTVGYLAREVAARYQPVLNGLTRRGETGWCPARITGGGPRNFGVYLYLGGPERLVPVNQPADLKLLDADVVVTVTGEERHQDVLEPLLAGNDHVTVFTELRHGTIERGKYAGGERLDVAIDGRLVGYLTSTMSARYLPFVKAELDSGRRVGAEASLYRDAKGVQVRLRLPSTSGSTARGKEE